MIAGTIATAASSTASSLAGNAFSQVLLSIVMGNFNPEYNREARKRMRYIQQKYSLAYEGGQNGEDPCSIISKIDPTSKLLMDPAGKKPANPFPDERSFEDSLVMNFHPVSGHQGRFAASHVLTSIGVINDYQNQRRRRPWVPGVMTPGKPNDYINLFLEETKVWLRTQMSLDNVSAEELKKREKFYSNLKHDNYYWCFPPESESCNIHRVIDFIHEKVKNALEIISREEMNKSLQNLFKELNDNTTNFFEFGKLFLAYLLFHSKKVGASITTTTSYDGNNIETGKFHYLLERVTSVVFETYQKDVEVTNQKLFPQKTLSKDYYIDNARGASPTAAITGSSSNHNNNDNLVMFPSQRPSSGTSNALAVGSRYQIYVKGYEKNTIQITSTVYLIQVEDPKQNKWIVRKTWNDFENFHNLLLKELSYYNISTTAPSSSTSSSTSNGVNYSELLSFPQKNSSNLQYLLNTSEYYEKNIELLNIYCQRVSSFIYLFQYPKIQKLISQFLETKYLMKDMSTALEQNSKSHFIYGEFIPNVFLLLKDYYKNHLIQETNNGRPRRESKGSEPTPIDSSSSNDGGGFNSIQVSNLFYNIFEDFHFKEWNSFQKTWGPEYGMKVITAYSLLQRIVTILGWTLEIHYFFLSMFGNTLTFSKLPLHDILTTQKELIQQFMNISNELYAFTCSLNEDSSYKFHKNLSMTENELLRVKFHGNKIISIIHTIEKDHLDYEAQLKRLKDCHERFQPLINRIGGSLFNIQNELELKIPNSNIMNLLDNNPSNLHLLNNHNNNLTAVPMITNGSPRIEEIPSNDVPQRAGLSLKKPLRSESKADMPREFKQEYQNTVLVAEEKRENSSSAGNHNNSGGGGAEAKVGDAAYAIFSRSNSETILPAVEKPNPLYSSHEELLAQSDAKKVANMHGSSPTVAGEGGAKRSHGGDAYTDKASDEELEALNIQYVRNEETSAVCIIS